MRATDFMRQMLALEEPWRVQQVTLTAKPKRLDVSLEHRPGAIFSCAECGQPRPIYDHLASRRWRDLDYGESLLGFTLGCREFRALSMVFGRFIFLGPFRVRVYPPLREACD